MPWTASPGLAVVAGEDCQYLWMGLSQLYLAAGQVAGCAHQGRCDPVAGERLVDTAIREHAGEDGVPPIGSRGNDGSIGLGTDGPVEHLRRMGAERPASVGSTAIPPLSNPESRSPAAVKANRAEGTSSASTCEGKTDAPP